MDVEAERQSKGSEPMARKCIFSKAGCKSLTKRPKSCNQVWKHLQALVRLLLGMGGQDNHILHSGVFVIISIIYYSNCFNTLQVRFLRFSACNRTYCSENSACLSSYLICLQQWIKWAWVILYLHGVCLLSVPINSFSSPSSFNNETWMRNNRIKKHSHSQI